ncbi:N-acetyltransferase [Natronincola ferrireducens]|uniref:Putative acetyltransferase n=1 Tax=Natronincola ferrireducens TaxID=393762 RepID=A0A1G9H090_9FIRM|nr:N-acetyltransferase [Natronincola ferrireducens]SDL06281.1 putative acetyltransferase [Natronincola ferrireducens]
MIKELDNSKIDSIMKIWLEANISAHDFIPADYWKSNYEYVKNALPDATVLVYEEGNEIKGFIGIIEESYIAGLFVSSKYQNEGIGSKLLERCKQEYSVLSLDVYARNIKALNFYKKHRFKIKEEKENDETKEIEYSMIWKL